MGCSFVLSYTRYYPIQGVFSINYFCGNSVWYFLCSSYKIFSPNVTPLGSLFELRKSPSSTSGPSSATCSVSWTVPSVMSRGASVVSDKIWEATVLDSEASIDILMLIQFTSYTGYYLAQESLQWYNTGPKHTILFTDCYDIKSNKVYDRYIIWYNLKQR